MQATPGLEGGTDGFFHGGDPVGKMIPSISAKTGSRVDKPSGAGAAGAMLYCPVRRRAGRTSPVTHFRKAFACCFRDLKMRV